MTLAQVQAAVAVVVALGLTWAGLLVAVSLLLPAHTEKAERTLEATPKRSFWHGLGVLLVAALALVALNIPNPLVKLVGFLMLLAFGCVLTIGAAGMAQLMGRRIGEMSGAKTSFGALVRGSLVFSAAVFFPLIGWYVFTPIASVCSLGAGFAALRSARRVATPPVTPSPAGAI